MLKQVLTTALLFSIAPLGTISDALCADMPYNLSSGPGGNAVVLNRFGNSPDQRASATSAKTDNMPDPGHRDMATNKSADRSEHPVVLTRKDAKGVGLSKHWRDTMGVTTHGPDGQVIFLFGASQPTVVCAPLQVCDIELQSGEVIRDVMVGDTVRWKVVPATSGATGSQAVHLIIKPAEPGLSTSMVVTTSRRTYHIGLKSASSDYMARVGFSYPDDPSTALADINARLDTGSTASLRPDQLSFSYVLSGSAPWRPRRVYSDSQKTYIEFPTSVRGADAPVLFVVSGGQNRLVNYRMKNNMMVVDYVIDRAILVSGVGWHQKKITIRKGG